MLQQEQSTSDFTTPWPKISTFYLQGENNFSTECSHNIQQQEIQGDPNKPTKFIDF